jgi:hypothetical protein
MTKMVICQHIAIAQISGCETKQSVVGHAVGNRESGIGIVCHENMRLAKIERTRKLRILDVKGAMVDISYAYVHDTQIKERACTM